MRIRVIDDHLTDRAGAGLAVDQASLWRLLVSVAVLLACLISGCKSTLDNLDVSNMLGPTGRKAREAAEEANGGRRMAELEGHEQFEEAKALYDAGNYKEARKKLQKIVKKYKNKPIEEDAMFYRAESDFHMDALGSAQDGYEELLKKHPSSRYLETSTQRLYNIALTWLGNPPSAQEVEMAYFARNDSEVGIDKVPETQVTADIWFPVNVVNRKKPIFDPQGRALEALRSVWMNDPTGPLADDALLVHAVHKLRRGNYIDADRDFATIREQYADREVAPVAYVLGAHSSLLAYQGSNYDGRQLEEAKQLTESALRLFPEIPQREKLKHDLERINAEFATRDWKLAQYHARRSEKSAAAYYLESMLKNQPESNHAEDARELLVKLGPEHSAGILTEPIYDTEVIPARAEEEAGGEAGRATVTTSGVSDAAAGRATIGSRRRPQAR